MTSPPASGPGSARRTALAVFAYSRPEHLERLLHSLARCDRLEECEIHILCDGPRSESVRERVERVRSIAREWVSERGGMVCERDENLGVARSIVSGVSELVRTHGRVIVVEDDLVLARGFVGYMLDGLDRYEAEERVFQLSGYMFPVRHPSDAACYLLPYISSWGWATWARAWASFEWEPAMTREILTDPAVRHRFDLDGSYPFSEILQERMTGANDSWAILWMASVFARSGLVLHPARSLVWNGGYDADGTHCTDPSALHQLAREEVEDAPEPREWPDAIAVDRDAMRRITGSLRRERRHREGGLGRIYRLAGRLARRVLP
jgi:hypothetical protein